ncbi:Laccase-1 [Operophtera brumata]|uniref:Laccase-1 n=1 Tax=Operophtera brumata TaxID=104452 RepID=A0A0L7L6T1_OPEBR|nr:Laccase-1 [Operophtera brumata]
MNSNSNSFDSFLPKIEADIDRDYRVSRLTWNSEMTMKLIEALEAECHVLWNAKHAFYKDKIARHAKTVYLADMFRTTTEEINRKIHNLRTQYNNELRKMKKKQEAGFERSAALASGWEYFEALSFLKTASSMNESTMMSIDPLDTTLEVESVNAIFGDFVASELRTLRTESRKKLKRMIQKAILQVGEEEDVNIYSS